MPGVLPPMRFLGTTTYHERWVAHVVNDEHVFPGRIEFAIRCEHFSERIPCELINGPKGTRCIGDCLDQTVSFAGYGLQFLCLGLPVPIGA